MLTDEQALRHAVGKRVRFAFAASPLSSSVSLRLTERATFPLRLRRLFSWHSIALLILNTIISEVEFSAPAA